MTLNPAGLGTTSEPERVTWTARDSAIYALSVGAGTSELAFTTDNTAGAPPAALPTMTAALGLDFGILRAAGEFTWPEMLHLGQAIEILSELGPAGAVDVTTSIAQMWDKGRDAIVVLEALAQDAITGALVFTGRSQFYFRNGGGWGGDRGPARNKAVRPPDAKVTTITYPTREDQALLYRLSGDTNPLHSDPAFARRAGFDRPILHGLCTFGFAGRAVAHSAADGDATRIRAIEASFAAPVFPGEELAVDLWQDDRDTRFEVRTAPGRLVLTDGRAHID